MIVLDSYRRPEPDERTGATGEVLVLAPTPDPDAA